MQLRKKDYLWSYIGFFLSLVANIILTPFIMYFLDDDSFGLWSVFQSLAAITTLFDFGFATTFSRNINYCWNGAVKLERTRATYSNSDEPNFLLMKKAISACKTVFLVISLLALVIMLLIGTPYIAHISKGTTIEGSVPIISWMIYTVAIFLNIYFGYYGSFLRGVGDISDANIATVIAKLVQIIVTVVFLWLGFGLIGTSVAYLSYGTLYQQIARKRFYSYKGIGKGLKSVKVKIPFTEIKEMFMIVWHNAWREGVVSLSNYLANQACTVICSLYMPLSQTGAYSLAVQLGMAVSQISATMYTANQPVLQSAYIRNEKNSMRKTMSLIIFTYVSLNMLGLVAVVLIGLPVLKLIKPDLALGTALMITIGIYQFMLKFRNCYTSYFSCTNRIPYVKAFLISSVGCVVLALIFLGGFKWGVWGLVVAQILSQGVYNVWAWAQKAHLEMKLSFSETLTLGLSETKKMVSGFLSKGGHINEK